MHISPTIKFPSNPSLLLGLIEFLLHNLIWDFEVWNFSFFYDSYLHPKLQAIAECLKKGTKLQVPLLQQKLSDYFKKVTQITLLQK